MIKIRIEWAGDYETPRAVTHRAEGQELAEAVKIMEDRLRPAGGYIAGRAISRLLAVMASRNMTDTDRRAWAEVMIEDLAPLPADLIDAACDAWRKSEKWLPTLSDLLGQMEPELTKRRLIHKALKEPVPGHSQISPSVPERVTADQVDAILAKHGVKPVGEDRDEKIHCKWKHPKPDEQPKPGLSQAQLDAEAAKDKAAYWLKMMGAG